MVVIKDMEMPSCCSQCDLCVEDEYADMTCVLLDSDWEETDYNENHRDENCPLVEIEERKVGYWDKTGGSFRCSECMHMPGFRDIRTLNYCPNCGAEMRGVENG